MKKGMDTSQRTGAESVHWNLDDLYQDPQQLEQDLEAAERRAASFAQKYRQQVSSLSPAQLAQALKEFEALHDQVGRAYVYAYLRWCTDTEDPKRGALLQKVRERYTTIDQQILFFELELIHLEEGRMSVLLESAELLPYRHYLEVLRLRKGHVLSEPEERILSEKSVTGQAAWERFFEETLSAARFRFRNQEIPEQEVLAKLYDPDREIRREAALALTEGLRRRLRELTYVFNTILADKASDDRLRRFESWLSSRNLSNEISDEAVQALVEAVTSRYDLVRRFYELKRRLLGYDRLYDYDRYAPVGETHTRYNWEEARELVLRSYDAFHPTLGAIARRFFEGRWIDAAVRPGKRGGAFSHRTVPQVHPYILMNFTGSIRDVQTLAHELGHGVHQYLSRRLGSLQARTPLTTSETASVFGEMLVFEQLMEQEQRPGDRLSLLATKLDDTLATVFRQVSMHCFEERIHGARRREGELSPERFSEFWIQTQEEMFGDSVTLGEHYRIWWSYIPHFIHTPGYVYAYAFGELLVLALYSLYRQEGEAFKEKYLQLLAAGGSDWPHVLVGRLGVDLQNPGFWHQGLGAVEELIRQAEELAAETTVGGSS